jgi:hypothetical protein
VAERSNAAVLKTVEPQGSGGSNPSSSASPAVAFGEGGHSINQRESKPRIRNGFEVFYFHTCSKESFFLNPYVKKRAVNLDTQWID